MNGTVVIIVNYPLMYPLMGEGLGVKIGKSVFPIDLREGDVRKLEPGQVISFMVNREGRVEIGDPRPKIGCERER